jgi:hypothetical protein
MKFKNSPLTATYNGQYTSTCTTSNNLVVRSSLAYERSFNHPLKILQASIDSKSKDSKIPSTWSFFMFTFQYDLNGGVTHK